jgi:hypothetical protein
MAIDYDAPVEASKSEDDWRAESDANTLARAEAIKEDKKRHDAAKAAAMKMLDDERKDVRLLAKVSGRRVRTPSPSITVHRAGSGKAPKRSGAHNVFKKI